MTVKFYARWHAASPDYPSSPIRLAPLSMRRFSPIRNEKGIAVDFEIEGEYPQYGNNDDRVDAIAVQLAETFMNKLQQA